MAQPHVTTITPAERFMREHTQPENIAKLTKNLADTVEQSWDEAGMRDSLDAMELLTDECIAEATRQVLRQRYVQVRAARWAQEAADFHARQEGDA